MAKERTVSSCSAMLITFAALIVICLQPAVHANAPELPRVEGVGAGLLRPQEVIVYWNSVKSRTDLTTAMYTVYYESPDGQRQSENIRPDTNFAIITNLRIDADSTYSFQVAASYIVNSSVVAGPLSLATEESRIEPNDSSLSMKDIATVVFGLLLVTSMIINVVLLLVNYILLKRFRKSVQFIKKVHSMSDISSQKSPSSTKGEVFVMSTHRHQPTRAASSNSPTSSSGRSVKIASIQEEDEAPHSERNCSSTSSSSSTSSEEISVEIEMEKINSQQP